MLAIQPAPTTLVHSLALPARRTRQPFFLLRWALGLALLAALLLPGLARAVPITLDVSAGNISIDTTALTYSSGGGSGSYTAADNFVIINSTTFTTVSVSGTGTVDITLDGASIDLSTAPSERCAFCIFDSATVNLTLTNDNTLTSSGGTSSHYAGLDAPAGTTLNISGAGSLTATGSYYGAGIGGGGGVATGGGAITIDTSGTVIANGGNGGAAGIGGGNGGGGGTITINGGTVRATGGSNGAGIGGGSGGVGGNITINDGNVTATGNNGAGIGGGANSAGGTIKITGGTVEAIGSGLGAGIGSAGTGSGGSIEITGGTVTATGGNDPNGGAGIGGGGNGASGDIVISGGTVIAKALVRGAGIGSGRTGAVGHITITGDANVTATGGSTGSGEGGAGIGSGGNPAATLLAAGTIVIDTTGTVNATGGTGGAPGGNGAPIGQGGGNAVSSYANGAGIAPVTDPTDQSATTGSNASFSVTVTPVGTTPPTVTYQWQVSTSGGVIWANVAGATTDTLNLTGVTLGMNGNLYRAVVTVTNVGAASSITYTTHAATLTVAAIVITIDTQPAASTTVTAGSISGSLSVAASVSTGATPAYLWYSNTTPSNSGGTSTGVTGATFTIPTGLAAGTYYYYCVASSPGAPNMASSVAVVTVNAAVIAPVITVPLTGALTGGTVGLGYSATLAASGTAPITWAVTSGALPPGLTLNTATGAISGTPTTAGPYSFSITASNGAGSDTAAFSIQILPTAAGQPATAVPTLDAAALAALALALAGLAGLGRKRGG